MDALNFSKITPEWLDQSLFEKAIRHYQNDSKAEVFEFSIKPASQPGQNFGSAIFRASITYKSKFTKDKATISVIIKTQPAAVELPGMEHFKDPALFIVESEMYDKILPEFQNLLSSAGDKSFLNPK
jgi:Ecdysteroid kinase-like family